jgi:hypothetical protein
MKKVLVVFVMVFGFAACNNDGINVTVDRDSLGKKLDTLGNKIEDKAEQVWDSTKSKAGQLKEGIEARFDSAGKKRNDTIR